jgi:glycosyltransferase involved in cell wall biosynthesis
VPDHTRLVLRGPGGRPLRVAHLTTVDMSLALLLRTELEVDKQAELETFGISAPGPYVEQLAGLGVRHVPLPALTRAWNPARDLRAVGQLAAALRRLRLDVLHTHNPKTGVIGRVVGRLAGVPVVVNTCHGLWLRPADPLTRRAFVLGLEAVAALASDAELYQNGEDRETLASWTRVRRSRVVGNGVDLDRFRPDPEGGDRVRRELGLLPGELLVGGVGRLVAEKGIEQYAGTAARLAGKARFVWVGPADDEKPDAVRTVPGVELLGERRDMTAIYSALDVFVLPSHREGFSRSAMEAAATGAAMVLTDIRGCREIGEHGSQVLLVPPKDEPALTEAVEQLLTDPGERARLGAAARARAQTEFDQRRVARSSLETYLDVARSRGLDWQVAEVAP